MRGQMTGRGERIIRASERGFRAVMWGIALYGAGVWLLGLYEWLRAPLQLSPYNAFDGHPAYRAFSLFIGAPVVAVIGILIVRKQQDNVIGPLVLSWGGAFASFGISIATAPVVYNLVSIPIAAWWTSLILIPFFFPDGRSFPRWLTPLLFSVIVLSLATGATGILANPTLDYGAQPANPFYIPAMSAINSALQRLYFALVIPLIPGIFVSTLLRYRRSGYIERQQIKAFAWWTTALLVPYLIFYILTVTSYENRASMPPMPRLLLGGLVGLIGLGPPIVIGYSMLRHRLFDIDVVIRRTLVYAIVTAVLAGVFYGAVLVLQRLFTSISGQTSPIALVASTLAIAALFSPLRRRVQDFVDRRFYRRKYDAQRVLSDFGRVARSETDVDALSSALGAALQETMQPSRLGVWLQPGDR